VALFSDGVTQHVVQVPGGGDVSSGAAHAWAFRWKLTTAAISDRVFQQFTTGSGGVECGIPSSGSTNFTFNIGSAVNIGCGVTGVVTTGVWQHWFIAYDGSQSTNATRLRIFLNGVAQTCTYSTTVPVTIPVSATNFTTFNAATPINGSLADLMVWVGVAPAGVPESQWLSYKPLLDNSDFNLQLWCPYDDGIGATNYGDPTFGQPAAVNITAVKSPDSPGISLGHPEMVIE
jgi:hypothetical protein